MVVSWWVQLEFIWYLLFLKSLNKARAFTKAPGLSLFALLMPHSCSRATESPWSTGAGDFLPTVHVVGARPGEELANGGMCWGLGRMGSRKQIVNWEKLVMCGCKWMECVLGQGEQQRAPKSSLAY